MKRVLPLILLLSEASAAYGQAERFGATAAEYRAITAKVALLESDLAGLSKRYGVPITTMRAIARRQVRALPALGAGPLRDTVGKLASEAATLRAQIRELQDRVRNEAARLATTSGPSARSDLKRISADLSAASTALDAGELSTARATLSRIAPEAAEIGSLGTDLWARIVKAAALLDYVSGDIDGFDVTLQRASRRIMDQATDEAWELEQERGRRLLEYGESTQDVKLIVRAATVLASGALPLIQPKDDVRRVRTLEALCRARISPFAEEISLRTWEAQRQRVPELVSTCLAAATSASRAEGASAATRSRAMSGYALALALRYMFENGEGDISEADDWLGRAKQLAERSGDADTARVRFVIAGDVASIRYAVTRTRGSLDEAVLAYQRALKLVDQATAPSEWAAAEQRLGSTYLSIYLDDHGRGWLVLADRHLTDALAVFTPTFSRIAWARAASTRAEVRGRLGITDGDRRVVEKNIAELTIAERVLSSESAIGKAEDVGRTRAELESFVKSKR